MLARTIEIKQPPNDVSGFRDISGNLNRRKISFTKVSAFVNIYPNVNFSVSTRKKEKKRKRK